MHKSVLLQGRGIEKARRLGILTFAFFFVCHLPRYKSLRSGPKPKTTKFCAAHVTGVLRAPLFVGVVLLLGVLCRFANDRSQTTKVRVVLHVRLLDVHGQFRYNEGTDGTPEEYVRLRPDVLHNNLRGFHALDVVPYLQQGGNPRLRLGPNLVRDSISRSSLVFSRFLARWDYGTANRRKGRHHNVATHHWCMLQIASHVHG